ncbi:MAG TPA: GNAT family N-acetyltransferase [Kofleriaceae bacterium]|nr:GNAT family N-acetyltransferase [Kofleriaceae bacterium]
MTTTNRDTTAAATSASHLGLVELAALFTACFEGYLVPVAQPPDALATRIRSEQVDLHLSRVLVAGGEAAGLCLLALRGRRARVAAMGIAAAWRGRGLGRALLDDAIATARAAGADRLCLEVFAQNRAAVALYEAAGFRRIRRLLGHSRPAVTPAPAPEHHLTDLEALATALAAEPERAWPWQLSPHTLVAASPALQVHALGREAYACLHPAAPGRLAVRILYVVPAARRKGRARRLLGAIQSIHPDASWDILPIAPEEFSPEALAALGFAPTELHQLEMERSLAP